MYKRNLGNPAQPTKAMGGAWKIHFRFEFLGSVGEDYCHVWRPVHAGTVGQIFRETHPTTGRTGAMDTFCSLLTEVTWDSVVAILA
jgi:hypothetical protein